MTQKRKPYNFQIFQGEDLTFTTVYKDSAGDVIDLTGYTARMQARPTYEDVTDPAILDLVSPTNIVITPAEGKLAFTITNAQSSAMPPAEYVYDAELVDGTGVVKKILFGKLTILPEVTK